jgi:hypothetical protein
VRTWAITSERERKIERGDRDREEEEREEIETEIERRHYGRSNTSLPKRSKPPSPGAS